MGASTSIIKGQINSAQESINYLQNYPSDPAAAALLTEYSTLQTNMNETLTNSSSLSPEILSARQNDYIIDINQLDIKLNSIKILINPESAAAYYYKEFTYYFGIMFGIIIITNKMKSSDELSLFKILKLAFYAVWGAAFYPLVLLWGVYDPPQWSAPLIPFFKDTDYSIFGLLLWPYRYRDFTSIEPVSPDLSKPIKTDGSKITLRILICIIIILLIIGKFIPQNITM